jgi:DNA/RNA-binding domain of Phe-tRNA-synthetase-like protein
MMKVDLVIDEGLNPCPTHPIVVWGKEIVTHDATGEFAALIQKACQHLMTHPVPDERLAAARNMLRYGKFKPSGRSKPASEFLIRSVQETGSLPALLLPVDINNLISIESGLPASIFDADLIGERLYLRRGLKDESYTFNPSGQSINLEDLLVVCGHLLQQGRRSELPLPCGNPVKDSMATKIHAGTRSVIGVIYAPLSLEKTALDQLGGRFAELLGYYAKAKETGYFYR